MSTNLIWTANQMATFYYVEFLPPLPANEVWGKVIFLHLFVILSWGQCLVRGGLLLGGVPGLGGVSSRGCLVLGGLLLGGVPGGDSPWMATAAGSTHPTGMHSCSHCMESDSDYNPVCQLWEWDWHLDQNWNPDL